MSHTFVIVTPRELRFDGNKVNVIQTQTVNLRNTLSYPIDVEIRSGNISRYKINDSKITLSPNQSKNIDIHLKLIKSLPYKINKIKDIFYIKSDFFNDKFFAFIIKNDQNQNINDVHQNQEIESNNSIQQNDINNNNNNNNNNNYILEEENKKLKNYVSKLENNVSELNIQLQHLQTIKTQINSDIPDLETIVDATIGKERALNEWREVKRPILLY